MSIPKNFTTLHKRATLYGIIRKPKENDPKLQTEPMSYYEYVGTLTGTLIENRFAQHVVKKGFDQETHCTVVIMEIDIKNLDSRFSTPNEQILAFELLSKVWRGNCNFIPTWRPGKMDFVNFYNEFYL
jgi:hypothetical protein